MNYTLRYTDYAEENLRDIALRIAQDDPISAVRYVEKIRAATDNLSRFPEMGSLARYAPARKRGVRVLVIDNYLVQYLISEKHQSIYIIKIAYGTQSSRRLFAIK